MKIVVIGGTGLIGSKLVNKLREREHEAIAAAPNTGVNTLTGEGLAVINEAPGYLKRTGVGSNWSESFQVMYDTDLFPFGRTLQPQETFESAKSSLVLFHDNDGFADSRWSVPGYVAYVISRRHGTRATPWIYNTWEPFQRRIDQSTVGELASAAKAMGMPKPKATPRKCWRGTSR